MQIIRALLMLSIICGADSVRAQDDEILETTEEFGITITPEQIWDTVEENQNFWPPVRHFVANKFTAVDSDIRNEAVAFIKLVHEDLNDRLLGEDEDVGMDLVDYIRARLRVFDIYRQLRQLVDDDATLIELKEEWEQGLRASNSLPAAQRQARIEEIVVNMRHAMETEGLDRGCCEEAMDVWALLAQATLRMNYTGAGGMMLVSERKAKELAQPVAELIRDVVFAADWAQIVKPQERLLKKSDFTDAWSTVKRLKQSRTARKPTEPVQQAG